MKVLLCHNFYRHRGGEDESFDDEAALLEANGHQVTRFLRHNAAIEGLTGLHLARSLMWNRDTYGEVRRVIERHRPDVVHCTNTFPLISPAVYHAASDAGIPVVQALRNYRLMCPAATFFREGRICERCLGKPVAWPAVVHACYHDNRVATAGTVAMLGLHRILQTFSSKVDLYFAPSEFTRRKYIEGGLPASRIALKPNCVVPDPGAGDGRGGHVVFVGRLAPEKGIETLLEAWPLMPPDARLRIVGEGPLAGVVSRATDADSRLEWLGRRSRADVLQIVGDAACLVMPSRWYETFGRVIIESYSRGTPVVASALGAMDELVEDGRTGYRVAPGEPAALAAALTRVLRDVPGRERMRQAARAAYVERFTGAANVRQLIEMYTLAGEIRRARAE